jgi:hypothetical protein
MKKALVLAAAVVLACGALCAQDKFTVSGTPIPGDLLKENYGPMPKGVSAYDLSICNTTAERQSVVSTQIYQALAQSNISLKPIGRQLILAAILRNQRRSSMGILSIALTSATGLFSILSTSNSMNVPNTVKTTVGLSTLFLGQITNSLQPVLPPDKVEKFDRDVLEPALVLDSGSCVERTVFALTDDPKAKQSALAFHVR